MQEKTTCRTYFAIKGNFNTEEISEILGMNCTGCHNIGEKKRYGVGIYDWSSWEFGIENEETLLADEQLEKVVDILIPKIEQLQHISKNYNCSFILEQVLIVNQGNTPAIGYKKKVIDFCSETNTEIDVDLYVNSWEDE